MCFTHPGPANIGLPGFIGKRNVVLFLLCFDRAMIKQRAPVTMFLGKLGRVGLLFFILSRGLGSKAGRTGADLIVSIKAKFICPQPVIRRLFPG